VAPLKLLAQRKLIRVAVDRHHDSNGVFKKILFSKHHAEPKILRAGGILRRNLGEGRANRAYPHFLCGNMRFSPGNQVSWSLTQYLPSPNYFLPRPRILRELIDLLNAEDIRDDGPQAHDEHELDGFNQLYAEGLERASVKLVFSGKKSGRQRIHPSQNTFHSTPRSGTSLVENTLWASLAIMHPDSTLKLRFILSTSFPTKPDISSQACLRRSLFSICNGHHAFWGCSLSRAARMYREKSRTRAKLVGPKKAFGREIVRHSGPQSLPYNIFGIDSTYGPFS